MIYMGQCELCGKEKKTRSVKEEGATIDACYQCVPDTSKDIDIRTIQSFSTRNNPNTSILKKTYELIDAYGATIRHKRESMNLTIEDLARKINISSRYLQKIEHEQITPDEKTIRLLERSMEIKLKALVDSGEVNKPDEEKNVDDKPMTLGDIIKNKIDLKE